MNRILFALFFLINASPVMALQTNYGSADEQLINQINALGPKDLAGFARILNRSVDGQNQQSLRDLSKTLALRIHPDRTRDNVGEAFEKADAAFKKAKNFMDDWETYLSSHRVTQSPQAGSYSRQPNPNTHHYYKPAQTAQPNASDNQRFAQEKANAELFNRILNLSKLQTDTALKGFIANILKLDLNAPLERIKTEYNALQKRFASSINQAEAQKARTAAEEFYQKIVAERQAQQTRELQQAQNINLKIEMIERLTEDTTSDTISRFFTLIGVSADAEPQDVKAAVKRLESDIITELNKRGFNADNTLKGDRISQKLNRILDILKPQASQAPHVPEQQLDDGTILNILSTSDNPADLLYVLGLNQQTTPNILQRNFFALQHRLFGSDKLNTRLKAHQNAIKLYDRLMTRP